MQWLRWGFKLSIALDIISLSDPEHTYQFENLPQVSSDNVWGVVKDRHFLIWYRVPLIVRSAIIISIIVFSIMDRLIWEVRGSLSWTKHCKVCILHHWLHFYTYHFWNATFIRGDIFSVSLTSHTVCDIHYTCMYISRSCWCSSILPLLSLECGHLPQKYFLCGWYPYTCWRRYSIVLK